MRIAAASGVFLRVNRFKDRQASCGDAVTEA
jgi:hypothetical protein